MSGVTVGIVGVVVGVVAGADTAALVTGAALVAGTQTDPPQLSPVPQQADIPLKTHWGWLA